MTALHCVSFSALGTAWADIYQWKYVDPVDPSQGKQPSTTLTTDGAGVEAVPEANLSARNLTMAYLSKADLASAYFYAANLTSADLSQANLANAGFSSATLIDANFTGANVQGAYFSDSTGFTSAQLYSTASLSCLEKTIACILDDPVNGIVTGQYALLHHNRVDVLPPPCCPVEAMLARWTVKCSKYRLLISFVARLRHGLAR